jgi:hypothetical protein
LSDQFVAVIAEQAFDLGVGERDLAGRIRHDHSVWTRFDGQTKCRVCGSFKQ